MSEQTMGAEAAQSPKDKAIAYIQYRDISRPSGKLRKEEMKQMGSEFPIKGVWKETELAAASAYERTLGRMDDNAVKRAMETMRPFAYDMARIYRYAAGVGELVLGGSFLTNHSPIVENLLHPKSDTSKTLWSMGGLAATVAFRPVEWGAARVMDVAGVIGSEAVAPIVNRIFKGGEPKQVAPIPNPA